MAKSRFLLQGMSETNDHMAAIQDLLQLPNIEHCLISVAFMNAKGIALLKNDLLPVRDKVHLYLGIRNGITSKQAIESLLSIGISPICVDTATEAYIFHPKVYISITQTKGKLIIGSANVTAGGLAKNIEASIVTELDFSNENDYALANSVFDEFESLSTAFPDNVFSISNQTDLLKLVNQGLLEDETDIVAHPSCRASSDTTRMDNRPRMILKTRLIQLSRHPRRYNINVTPDVDYNPIINQRLLWRSKPLSRRDLNIPNAARTNETGSMFLNRGDPTQQIGDFQHYFRDEVFASAEWVRDIDPRKSYYERALVKFRLIIKGVDYGIHTLKVSHNTNTESEAYKQRNSMTQIHWGEVKSLISHDDLLEGVMSLYAPESDSSVYTLKFDND